MTNAPRDWQFRARMPGDGASNLTGLSAIRDLRVTAAAGDGEGGLFRREPGRGRDPQVADRTEAGEVGGAVARHAGAELPVARRVRHGDGHAVGARGVELGRAPVTPGAATGEALLHGHGARGRAEAPRQWLSLIHI